MRHIPKAYERYRHFKGKEYQILAIARHSEDESEQVVYQALYPPFTIYVRPLSLFMSEVDREKYPSAAQRYRFELISGEETAQSGKTAGTGDVRMTGTLFEAVSRENARASSENPPEKQALKAMQEQAPEAMQEQAPEAMQEQAPEIVRERAAEESEEEWAIDKNVLAFLDADTYEQKLSVFSAMHDKVTQDMLNTIAASLDIEVDSGSLEERYRQIQNCLMTFQRYECNRLR